MRRRYQEGGLAAAGEDEDQDLMSLGGDDTEDVPGGAVNAAGGLSALDFPGAAEAFQLMQKSAADARKALQDARQSIMARQYGRSDALLAAAAALGSPTRTGSTAESFGAMAGALREPLAARRAFETQKQKDLLGVNTQLAGIDEREATARLSLAQLNARLKAEAAKAGNDIILDEHGNPRFASHSDARNKPAYTPPVPSGFTVVQQPQPDGTSIPKLLNTKTGELTDAGGAYVPPSRLSQTGRLQAQGKLQTTEILKEQLEDVKNMWKPLKNSMSAGYLQGWIPTEKGKQFDKAVAAMRGTIRQLTRVPGEGSMSDWEGKIDQAKLPDRNEYEAVTEQSIEQLEKLIKKYEETTKEMLGPGTTNTIKFDKTGKRVQ